MTVVVPGRACASLAASLAREVDADVAATETKTFPDGEILARVEDDLSSRDVLVVQSTTSNDALVELMLLLDAAREAGAGHVTAVVPYFGYARQDRSFRRGEAVSSRTIMKALAADAFVTVDPHKESILAFFHGDARSVSAVPLLADRLGALGIDAILAPDAGARSRADAAATALGVPHDHLEKTRLGPEEVVMRAKELDVDGQAVAILDDMIASGTTMVHAARQLKEQGATRVYAACTHGVFTGAAVKRLLDAGIDQVLCTDTIPSKGADVVPAAPALREAIVALARH